MKCVSCLQGTPWECRQKGDCDELDFSTGDDLVALVSSDGTSGIDESKPLVAIEAGAGSDDPDPESFITYKDDSVLRDQQSTGRKRAAKLYPLKDGEPCDWKMQKNCGGGELPIVGCKDGKQQARHHGPDKNTLNNEKGNVHRICHTCHNRWHTLNDPGYVWGGIYELHNPSPTTEENLILNELFWENRQLTKPEH